MQAKEAAWYDEYYKHVQTKMAPWYQYLLPDLLPELNTDSRLIELGCGQGHILRLLTRHSAIKEENIFGIDQSSAQGAHQHARHLSNGFSARLFSRLPADGNDRAFGGANGGVAENT
jgi:hypothetical protein